LEERESRQATRVTAAAAARFVSVRGIIGHLACVATGQIQILDEHDFVLLLVVDQLVGDCSDKHETESSRPQSLLVAYGIVIDGAWCVLNGGMCQSIERKPRPRVSGSPQGYSKDQPWHNSAFTVSFAKAR
jgi:hypothetical protein